MSKKILSLALAVVMLFSICAVAASAVQGDGSENIRIYMTSDATVGATAGTEVNVKFYIDLPDGVDELDMCIGNISIGYNSAKYKLKVSDGATNGDEARTWGDDFGGYMKGTAHVVTASSSTIVGKFNDNDNAKGWDSACMIQELYEGTAYKANTGFPVYDNMHIFTLTFVAQDTLTANDVIGVVEGAYGSGSYFRVCWFNGTTTAQLYPVAQVDMADAAAVAPSAPSYQVYKLSDARKHSNGDGTNTVAAFFAFDTSVIDPNFNANGTSLFVNGITATVSNGESSITPDPIKYLYKIDADTYGFRVIMHNVPDGANVTVKPIVTTDGTTYTVETINFAVADLTNYE